MFFKSEDPASLKELIIRHFTGRIDVNKQLDAIEKLNELYSWNNSAKKTLSIYNI